MKKKTWLSWSSGKDSAFALHELRREPDIEVTRLLTTVTREYDRVSMHGVRRELLEAQARAIGLPLEIVEIPSPCTNQEYEDRMRSVIEKARADGIACFAFGDLFLEDIRSYRERQLSGTGIQPLFPLWLRPTGALARQMVASGSKAILTCVDTAKLDPRFSGREYDLALLADLGAETDPCGERGEFHTFVYDSPLFDAPIAIERGDTLIREGFAFTDLRLGRSGRR